MALRFFSRLPTGDSPHQTPDLARIAMALPLSWQILAIAGWVAFNVTAIFENIGTVQEGIQSIAQSCLVKSVSLFKMASADPFSTVAFLRTMADVDSDHAVVRSMSAAYWRGGEESVERVLYRPQYFDKLVAWATD